MIQKKHLCYLLLAGLTLLLAVKPAAILAADQDSVANSNIYFPITMKPGTAGSADILTNGGTVEGPDGVGIGALTNTLEAPIQVTISETSAPTTSVPPPAQVLGNFYRFSAEEDIFVSPEQPLIIALPIPTGAVTGNLALAILQSAEEISDFYGDTSAWIFQEGMLDPDRSLFLTTLAGLTQGGHILALVEHPDFDSPSNNAPSLAPATMNSPTGAIFRVRCINFNNTADCTPTTEAIVADYMSEIYSRFYEQIGFERPRLRFLNETLHYDPNSLTALGYTIYIEPFDYPGFCDPISVAGYYSVMQGRLVLCMDPALGIPSAAMELLIHEYFHATQYAYLATLADYADGSREKWVIEGMAASAMGSYSRDDMQRTNYFGPLHDVDLSLKTYGSPLVPYEYMAQDFWVYYGLRNGLDLSYLEGVLELGATSQAVSDVLDNGTLLNAYWDWVKNHVMEPEVDYDGMLGTPCQLETGVVVLPEEVTFGGYTDIYHDILLEPLTSAVIDLRWDWDGYSFTEGRVFPTPLTSQDPAAANLALRFKFYEEGEANCETVPDRGRTYNNPDPDRRYYLVISNIDHDTSYQYRVGFEVYPDPP